MPAGGGTTTTTSTQELAPEQRQLLSGVIPAAQNYMNTPLQQFPGSAIAGFNPTQVGARGMIADTAQNTIQPLANDSINASRTLTGFGTPMGLSGSANLLNAGQQGNQGLGGILDEFARTSGSRDFLSSGALMNPASNPVLEAQTNAAIRPLQENLTQKILPGINSEFVGSNMFGSSRQGVAQGAAIGDFIKQAGDISTNLQSNNFNQGLDAMLKSSMGAASLGGAGVGQGLSAGASGTNNLMDTVMRALAGNPQLAQLAYLPGTSMEALGESQRGLDQARLSEQSQRFTTAQMLPFLQAQDVANLAFGIGGGSATTTAQQNAAFNPMSTVAGIGTLLSGLSGMF